MLNVFIYNTQSLAHAIHEFMSRPMCFFLTLLLQVTRAKLSHVTVSYYEIAMYHLTHHHIRFLLQSRAVLILISYEGGKFNGLRILYPDGATDCK